MDVATELELYWNPHHSGGYTRTMPNGQTAIIEKISPRRYELHTGFVQLHEPTSLSEAVAAAGRLAQAQLKRAALTWSMAS